MLQQQCCDVNEVLEAALEAEPGTTVWFMAGEGPDPAVPVAGVAARRHSGSVCLLGQHPAAFCYELVAELSYEHPGDRVWLLVPGKGGERKRYSVCRAEVIDGALYLSGPSGGE